MTFWYITHINTFFTLEITKANSMQIQVLIKKNESRICIRYRTLFIYAIFHEMWLQWKINSPTLAIKYIIIWYIACLNNCHSQLMMHHLSGYSSKFKREFIQCDNGMFFEYNTYNRMVCFRTKLRLMAKYCYKTCLENRISFLLLYLFVLHP